MTDKEKLEQVLRTAIKRGKDYEEKAKGYDFDSNRYNWLQAKSEMSWQVAEEVGSFSPELCAIFDELTGVEHN
jgi:hypothetical protein